MSMADDLLDEYHAELELVSRSQADGGDVDRREFVFLSLVAAAASTLRFSPPTKLGSRSVLQQAATPPIPLGNGESPAFVFQPYPAGTGALMEQLVRERGARAFERSVFKVEKWSGAVPASPEDIAFLPAHRLSALLKAKKITSVALTTIYLERLKRLNPTLLAAVTIMEAAALAEAESADREIAAGRYRGPLHGIPYGLKDLFATKGAPTTWGSPDFDGRVIDEDAEIVVRLRNAGAVLIAKLSTGLFAQNDQWFRGRTNNPWNLSQGSSGSSAGPASATAAGCVGFAIGTETSGSIVSPALRCGVSALRPTFGRVSRHGGMVLAWTMDRVGPMCRTIEDCAMVFSVMHGVDPKDPSTVTMPFDFDRDIDLSGLRVGVDPAAPKEFIDKLRELGVKPKDIGARPTLGQGQGGALGVESAAAFDEFVQRKAKEIGLDLTTLPDPPPPTTGPGAPAASPASTNPMAPADWNPRFVRARTAHALEFLQGHRRRYILVNRWAEFMKELDLFIGAPGADIGINAQTGHPCVVLPYKFDVPEPPPRREGAPPPPPTEPLKAQPIGAVIVGNLYRDDTILSVAHRYQQHTDWHTRRPAL